MGWASTDLEKYQLLNLVKENEEIDRQKDERIKNLEGNVFMLKEKMAEFMNITMEYGMPELLDSIEDVLVQKSEVLDGKD